MGIEKEREVPALLEGKWFRVNNISRVVGVRALTKDLIFKDLELSEGLAIEERQGDGTYLVVNMVYWDNETEDVELTDCLCRSVEVMNYSDKDIPTYFERTQEYCSCLGFAVDAMRDLHDKRRQEEEH